MADRNQFSFAAPWKISCSRHYVAHSSLPNNNFLSLSAQLDSNCLGDVLSKFLRFSIGRTKALICLEHFVVFQTPKCTRRTLRRQHSAHAARLQFRKLIASTQKRHDKFSRVHGSRNVCERRNILFPIAIVSIARLLVANTLSAVCFQLLAVFSAIRICIAPSAHIGAAVSLVRILCIPAQTLFIIFALLRSCRREVFPPASHNRH